MTSRNVNICKALAAYFINIVLILLVIELEPIDIKAIFKLNTIYKEILNKAINLSVSVKLLILFIFMNQSIVSFSLKVFLMSY